MADADAAVAVLVDRLLAWAHETTPLTLADRLDRFVLVETAVCQDRLDTLKPFPMRTSRDLRPPLAVQPHLLPL